MYQYFVKSTRNLDISLDIFRGYPDVTYLVKLSKLNRPCIEVRDEDKLVGLVVFHKHNRFLKLCLLIVHRNYVGLSKSIAESLINLVKDISEDAFNGVDVLYTVCPYQFNTDRYQQRLIKSGFQLTTIKANGDIVYTYAGPV